MDKKETSELTYGKLNVRDTLQLKEYFKTHGVNEKEYVKWHSSPNNKYSITKFTYIPEPQYYFTIEIPNPQTGVFGVDVYPYSNYRQKTFSQLPFTSKSTFSVVGLWSLWLKKIADEIKSYEKLYEMVEEQSYTEVKEAEVEHNTTHQPIITALGRLVISFETMLAMAKDSIHILVKLHGDLGASSLTEIMLYDSKAMNISKFFLAGIHRQFDIMRWYKEMGKEHIILPDEQKEHILELAGVITECLSSASSIRNAIVHATWGLSVQGEKISLYGQKLHITKSLKVKRMDYGEKDFDDFTELFNYITYAIRKFNDFIAVSYKLSQFSIYEYDKFKEDVKIENLRGAKAKLDKAVQTMITNPT